MPSPKRTNAIEDTMEVSVHRTKELTDKLAVLPKEDLVLLRRVYDTPNDQQAQNVISRAILDEYTLHELRIALAALDGVHELPLGEKPIGFETAKPYAPHTNKESLPPLRVFTPISESPSLPSAKVAQEISDILISLSFDDFQWLIQHFGKPHDLRSRLIFIKHRLYRYQWEDIAATIAALQRTLPPSETD